MITLVCASANPHKVAEIQQILGDGWQVAARDPGVEETGETFEENALIKARALVAASGGKTSEKSPCSSQHCTALVRFRKSSACRTPFFTTRTRPAC